MYCPECGANNPDDSLFCERCGTPFEPQPTSRPTPVETPANRSSVPSGPPAQRGGAVPYVIIGIAVAICLATVGVVMFMGRADFPHATQASQTETVAEATSNEAPTDGSASASNDGDGSQSDAGATGDDAATASGNTIPPAADLATSERPTLADFTWYTSDVYAGNIPAGTQSITNFSEAEGGWKAYLIDEISGPNDTINERFLNVYLTGTPDSVKIAFDWFYVLVGSTGDGHDDDTPESTFVGAWDNGGIEARGSGLVRLTAFWYQDGRECAIGSFMWPDGATAALAMTRP